MEYLNLFENECVSAFCAFGSDFSGFRGKIMERNLFSDFGGGFANNSKDSNSKIQKSATSTFISPLGVGKDSNHRIQKCVFMEQIHSNEVRFYNASHNFYVCDGLICDESGVALCVLSADCLPLLLWHKSGYIAALHSGRAGSFGNILQNAISLAQRHYEVDSSDWTLVIAPSICAKNYEIDGEVLAQARENFGEFLNGRKLDLKSLIKTQAENLGIKNVLDCGICSFGDERFYSYRRDKTSARFVSVIVLK